MLTSAPQGSGVLRDHHQRHHVLQATIVTQELPNRYLVPQVKSVKILEVRMSASVLMLMEENILYQEAQWKRENVNQDTIARLVAMVHSQYRALKEQSLLLLETCNKATVQTAQEVPIVHLAQEQQLFVQ